jgi:hypothetical protein
MFGTKKRLHEAQIHKGVMLSAARLGGSEASLDSGGAAGRWRLGYAA